MPHVSASVLSAILYGARQYGVDSEYLLQRFQIKASCLKDPLQRFDCDLAFELMIEAQQQSGDAIFGFHVGQRMLPANAGLTGYLIASAETLRDGIASFCRYQRVLGEGIIFEMTPAPACLNAPNKSATQFNIVTHPEVSRQPGFHTVECCVSGFLTMISGLLGKKIQAESVSFCHKSAGQLDEYQAFFGTSAVWFGQSENAIVIEDSYLDLTLLQANQALFRWSERQAEQILRHTARSGYRSKVSQVILKQLKGELPRLESVARTLNISSRALQRHLKSENSQYMEILEEVRRESAMHHLKSGQMTVEEIGYLLGYSDVSAFRKAFKKWTGKTPSGYRSEPGSF